LSDNDDRKENEDLTRIEDLSEFLHSEDDDDLSDLATDPDINIPAGFTSSDEHEITDFDALENESVEPPKDEFPDVPELPQEEEDDIFESEDNFGSDETIEDNNNFENEDAFGSDDSLETKDEFGSDDNFESEDAFGSDDNFESEDAFGSDDNFETEDTFGTDDSLETEDAFGSDDSLEAEDTFGSDESLEAEDAFGSDDNFETEDTFESDDSSEVDDSFETDDNFENQENSQPIDSGIDEPIIQDQAEDIPPIENIEQSEKVIETSFNQEEKTQLPQFEKPSGYEAPENFKQLQQFAKNMSYGNMAKEGTPPFSIVIKDIKFEEDVEDILILLKELKVIVEEDEEKAKESLERGSMLLPRLGEYSAITICHKLRRFDINILMGLTEEINPPKSYQSDDRGLTTKHNIYNNRKHNWNFDNNEIGIQDIIVSTTATLNGYDITDYITVATEFIIVDMENFTSNQEEQDKIVTTEIENIENQDSNIDFFNANINLLSTTEKLSIQDIYKSLIEKLKAQAVDKKANAVVGINFQVSPILIDDDNSIKSRYQVTCSGSIVWVIKK
jgi:uncharacterized protein YbjQ (UPF0145 family)